jgi:hypothetical protein
MFLFIFVFFMVSAHRVDIVLSILRSRIPSTVSSNDKKQNEKKGRKSWHAHAMSAFCRHGVSDFMRWLSAGVRQNV